MRRTALLALLSFLSALVFLGTAQPSSGQERPVPEGLADSAGDRAMAYPLLRELVTRFGARPAGSRADHAAAAWLAMRLRTLGFEQVAVEPFPIRRWSAGVSSVRLVGSEPRTLVATPLGGLAAGPPVQAPLASFATYEAFLAAPEASIRGRIVAILQPLARTTDGSAYLRMVAIRGAGPSEAMKRGAVGFVMRSLATHGKRIASSGATTPLPRPFPAFALSPPDSELLAQLSEQGRVTLRLASTAGWTGRGTSQNVTAVVPGRHPAAPAILISAHLDSWEQGTGAIDDGFGIATVIAAAKTIRDLPERPLRSIRLVLFGAEEVTQPEPVKNFAGARAHLDRHRAELSRVAMASESDWGGGRVIRLHYPGTGDVTFERRSSEALAPLGVQVVAERPETATPDAAVLAEAGVPLFRLDQDATTLFDIHHNPDDTLIMVDRAALEQNVAAWATTLWLLANSELVRSAPSR
jgi:carboxypeptidase Q